VDGRSVLHVRAFHASTHCVGVWVLQEVDLAIAADLGTLQRLPHVVGHAAAMDLALTARQLGAAEALRMGLVSDVIPSGRPAAGAGAHPAGSGQQQQQLQQAGCSGRAAVVGAAVRLAQQLEAKPALALQGTKRTLLHAR
jgi:enoyl-CoA hydratase/carnithine racemase